MLARWTLNPELKTHRVRLVLDLKDRIVKPKVFLVAIEQFGRRLVFTPSVPSLWFEVLANQDLTQRANEVFEAFCRQQLKDSDSGFDPGSIATPHEAWVTTIDVDVPTEQISREESERKLASLWSDEEMNGHAELHRVGRCLDHAYPSDLETAVCREQHVNRIDELLTNPDRRPVLIIGPALAGKTAVIHEVVRTRVERLEKTQKTSGN